MARQNKTSRRRKTAARTSAKPQKAATPASSEAGLPKGVFALGQDRLERYLLTGEAQGALEDYFGPAALGQLQDLARQAAARGVRGGPRVLILPGIMGSTLAKKALRGNDVLWIDPIEIALGNLTRLRLEDGASAYFANGVVLFAYLQLKLRLKLAGFDADFFPFDWRCSLDELGAALATRVAQETSSDISLVAHSMGSSWGGHATGDVLFRSDCKFGSQAHGSVHAVESEMDCAQWLTESMSARFGPHASFHTFILRYAKSPGPPIYSLFAGICFSPGPPRP